MKTNFIEFIKDDKTNFTEFVFEYTRTRTTNYKPAVDFDEYFGTNLSQKYKFPFGLTDDEVWAIHVDCIDNKNCNEFDNILKNLNYSYFPLKGIESLSNDTKYQILLGMASGFNYDDIIWFAIDHMYYFKNIEVNAEIKKMPKYIENKIQWVLSPKTAQKLKKELNQKDNILNKELKKLKY
jgi:hypothetical protein